MEDKEGNQEGSKEEGKEPATPSTSACSGDVSHARRPESDENLSTLQHSQDTKPVAEGSSREPPCRLCPPREGGLDGGSALEVCIAPLAAPLKA